MRRHLSFLALAATLCVVSLASAQTPAVHMVPMRDGVRLATVVYLPEGGAGPWPVVLGRTPYGRHHPGSVRLFDAAVSESRPHVATRQAVLRSGIAIVIQETRGYGESEGELSAEDPDGWGALQDGYDTVVWVRQQAWCNGKIAGAGSSAGGMAQRSLAGTGPEGMAGQLIYQAPLSAYHHVDYTGGVFRKAAITRWLEGSWLPHETGMALLAAARSHPYYGEPWRTSNLAERVERVNWPVTIAAAWYDFFQQGTIDLYTEIRHRGGPRARENVYLQIGPYTHHSYDLVRGPALGEVTLPAAAHVPYDRWPEDIRWIKHWLLGEPLDPHPPRVLYYVMGELPPGNAPGNEWRAADDWPPPAEQNPWFLTAEHALRPEPPARQGTLRYAYDPADPVPTLGGNNLFLDSGPFDQRPVEDRPDVLLFTSSPLAEPLEVTGPIAAVLQVSTGARDTDFTAKLTDVYPDGRSMLVGDGIRRLSLRKDLSAPQEVVPGERYCVAVEMGSTSLVFNTGHRIRLAVSSSNDPRFEPNPNTGSPDWQSTETTIAQQTVFVGGDDGSYLLLPHPLAAR